MTHPATPPPSASHSPTHLTLSSLSSALSWGYQRLAAAPAPAPAPPQAAPRRPSPYQPPPLSPLRLAGYADTTAARLLTRALAEEIRALLPARLQLADTWTLCYSLEQHGTSLQTLFESQAGGGERRGGGGGEVLVVRDALGGVFGAFVNEPFRPSGRYYGTGECFLWKAASLPPLSPRPPLSPARDPSPPPSRPASTASDRIRFKAFPYSGVNDYMIFCEPTFLSVGGGNGRYGLWLDDAFERGVSGCCQTFGNEPLSEERGGKFDVMGVELWRIGA